MLNLIPIPNLDAIKISSSASVNLAPIRISLVVNDIAINPFVDVFL